MAQGTGLAGGIFQGILASEDIANKRDDRQRLQALTLSQLETSQVDRQAKALNMEQTQLTIDQAKDRLAKEKQFADITSKAFTNEEMTQVIGEDGGLVNKMIRVPKTFTGINGMTELNQITLDVTQQAISLGLIDAKTMGDSLKHITELGKQIGTERLSNIIRNPSSQENINYLGQLYGVNPEGASFKVDNTGVLPSFKYVLANGKEIDVTSTFVANNVAQAMDDRAVKGQEIRESKADTELTLAKKDTEKALGNLFAPDKPSAVRKAEATTQKVFNEERQSFFDPKNDRNINKELIKLVTIRMNNGKPLTKEQLEAPNYVIDRQMYKQKALDVKGLLNEGSSAVRNSTNKFFTDIGETSTYPNFGAIYSTTKNLLFDADFWVVQKDNLGTTYVDVNQNSQTWQRDWQLIQQKNQEFPVAIHKPSGIVYDYTQFMKIGETAVGMQRGASK